MSIRIFENMIGRTMVEASGDRFVATDGSVFTFSHGQNCCESVDIEQVDGDFDDLLGEPMTMAEEVDNDFPAPLNADSYTWTFYKFATRKGFVTVRWLGESNGHYSERVDYEEVLK